MKFLHKILILAIIFSLLSFDMPKGWTTGKSVLERYDVGLDKNAGRFGSDAGTIKCKSNTEKGFGTLFQYCVPDTYIDKRVRFSGYMKTTNVSGWAGFWLRTDQSNSSEPMTFDNMFERSLKDNMDWTFCEIVLDIPIGTTNIAMGALLTGPGQIWIDDLKFEVVDTSVPTTGTYKLKKETLSKGNLEPTNLSFDN